ncbi:Hypothetical_protein [Hexamita inflata]|uniref:Hypothetical_protein n=1 Tax=Hexamita inflata TaxID=28002 RepID=A0AA86R8T0_9EUKA|nr:Hypothetical protein HINF_LOCUS61191 [Hexamita inflata]
MNSNLAQQLEIKCSQLKQITEQLTIQLNSNTQSTKDLTLTQQTPLQSQIVKNEEFDFDSGFNSNPVDLIVQNQLDSIQDSINKLNSLNVNLVRKHLCSTQTHRASLNSLSFVKEECRLVRTRPADFNQSWSLLVAATNIIRILSSNESLLDSILLQTPTKALPPARSLYNQRFGKCY